MVQDLRISVENHQKDLIRLQKENGKLEKKIEEKTHENNELSNEISSLKECIKQ